jgi:hypothetical protein
MRDWRTRWIISEPIWLGLQLPGTWCPFAEGDAGNRPLFGEKAEGAA